MKNLFDSILRQAVRDFEEHGYTPAKLQSWQGQLRGAIQFPDQREKLARGLARLYRRVWTRGSLQRRHKDFRLFTLDTLEAQYRPLLDQRIVAAADLIVLNRDKAVQTILSRFSGWATSVPPGGGLVDVRKTISNISKPLRSQTFEERRLSIDQGHKLLASIDAVVGQQHGAIAAIWHSYWRQPGYDYRVDHKARDKHVYAIRGNWAMEQGLMKVGKSGYTDEITEPAFEPFCQCYYERLYAIRDLPDEMLTQKGRDALKG